MTTRTLRIAGAQLVCRLGQREDNLSRAGALAARAAAEGAQLILFPELMSSGYSLSPQVWRSVEPPHGPTARWLASTAARLGVYLGTTFVELDGGHIYNTFVLTDPDGRVAGRVRKSHVETYLFQAGRGGHTIDCGLGRIGVGICADNQYADFVHQMRQERPDLLLMPHAGPAAHVVGGAVSEADVREQHDLLSGMAPAYARILGAPALFVNQCGPTVGRPGIGLLGSFVDRSTFHFPGRSTIADSDGRVVAHLDEEEGVVYGEVTTDPTRYPNVEPRTYGPFAVAARSPQRRALFALDGALGRFYYRCRHQRARLTLDSI